MSGFLVMLREGVEAALIVGILLAFVVRMKRPGAVRWIWWGTGSAVVLSLAAGFVIFETIGALEGTAEIVAEGSVALIAAGLLTWMVFWMGSRARSVKSDLESSAEAALAGSGSFGLAMVAFVAVLREGLESALFMISLAVGTDAQVVQFSGGVLGLLAAVSIGYLVYRGGRRIDLRHFFRLTGVLVVIVAAGLIGKAVHEFQEVGLVPVLVEHVWNVAVLDPGQGLFGAFMKTLFGISNDPSLLRVAAYWAYLVPVLASFLQSTRSPAAPEPASV